MATLTYPTSNELNRIDPQLLQRMTQDSPIFRLFPIRVTDNNMVSWEQRDNYLGLTQARGFNGFPPSVPRTGSKRYNMMPSAYGEFELVDELEITSRAAFGTYNQLIPIGDLIEECREKLMTRQVNRMEWILWTLLTTGTFAVLDVKGALVHADSYTPLTFASAITWATAATATPLADLRAVQLLHRGVSVSFGDDATAFMNRGTWNSFISNTNQADFGGRKGAGLQSIQSLGEANELLTRDGLPNITIYDEGYLDDSGTFQLWIPNNKVIVVGRRRNGAMIGEFLTTRNASNPDLSGNPYVKVVDTGAAPNEPPPRRIEVHRGFNGGPTLYYPGSIVVMTV